MIDKDHVICPRFAFLTTHLNLMHSKIISFEEVQKIQRNLSLEDLLVAYFIASSIIINCLLYLYVVNLDFHISK